MQLKSSNGRAKKGLRNAVSLGSLTFVISLFFTGPVQSTLKTVEFLAGLAILALIIGCAVLADILAIAATAADESPFHAMATDRIPGAKESVAIVRNGDRVNSMCADVIGDISGTVCGAIGAALVLDLRSLAPTVPMAFLTMMTLGLIAAVTVGGKASTKAFAVRNANTIVGLVGKVWYVSKRIVPAAKMFRGPST